MIGRRPALAVASESLAHAARAAGDFRRVSARAHEAHVMRAWRIVGLSRDVRALVRARILRAQVGGAVRRRAVDSCRVGSAQVWMRELGSGMEGVERFFVV